MNNKSSLRAVLPLFMALLYGVSPIDLIPDILPLIGLVDDALLVPLLLIVALVQFQRSKKEPQKAMIKAKKL